MSFSTIASSIHSMNEMHLLCFPIERIMQQISIMPNHRQKVHFRQQQVQIRAELYNSVGNSVAGNRNWKTRAAAGVWLQRK